MRMQDALGGKLGLERLVALLTRVHDLAVRLDHGLEQMTVQLFSVS